MNREAYIVAPLLLLVVSLGCTRLWTKRFVFDETQPQPMIKNWRVKPDFMAHEGIASDTALVDRNRFSLWIRFADWEAKKGGDVWDVHIDTARIWFPQTGDEIRLWGRFVNFRTYPETKYVEKTFSFRGLDFVGDPKWKFYSFYIPPENDSVLVEFLALLRPGLLVRAFDEYSIEMDSIRADETGPVDTVMTSFWMHRSVTSHKTWKLFQGP